MLTFTDPLTSALTALLLLVAVGTDYLDGYIARRNQSVSNLGKILDPLADKLLVVATLIMLSAMNRPGGYIVPAWLVVVIIGRETAVTILRGIALTEGIVMEAENLGKYKFVLQSIAVFALVLHYPYMGIDFYVAGMYFLVLAMVIGLWSGVNYHVKFLRLLYQRNGTVKT
jgi:CDP-diacylglycerol--glycerol-3-phosphate 3-phosphatidyltransferase